MGTIEYFSAPVVRWEPLFLFMAKTGGHEEKMKDLLEKECVVVSSKKDLLKLCSKYRIPNKDIETNSFEMHSSDRRAFLVSRKGVRDYDIDYSKGLTVFKSSNALELYLFEYALRNGKIVVHKGSYKDYLKTAKLLRKIGIRTIIDRTYFQEAYCFYVFSNAFRELNLFGCKCIVSMANGIQFSSGEFLRSLKALIRNKNRYEKEIAFSDLD